MISDAVHKMTEARIPTEFGTFQLHLYQDDANLNHVALVLGDVAGRDDVLTRVHSECFTAEVLGSLRCDCAGQLRLALEHISRAGSGILIYLRQEGRGIGLLDKLRAYNLQDLGHDTVDANLMLGYGSDERTYHSAACILHDLQVRSIQLLTNNPLKTDGLRDLGIAVTSRRPLVAASNPENTRYLDTKVRRMRHEIDLDRLHKSNGARVNGSPGATPDPVREIGARIAAFRKSPARPFVTLSYAQSLDGCIASARGEPLALSGPETLTLAHRLRAAHGCIVVGIGTVLSDNPRLTVRRVPGRNPQPIVLDSRLRIPLDCQLLRNDARSLWVATVDGREAPRRCALEAAGATVLSSPAAEDGRVDIRRLLFHLASRGVTSVMVEGGVQVIRSFMDARLVDYLVVTVAPRFIGGEIGVRIQSQLLAGPCVDNFRHCKLGEDLVLWGEPVWREDTSSRLPD